jgi:hypothetical protein
VDLPALRPKTIYSTSPSTQPTCFRAARQLPSKSTAQETVDCIVNPGEMSLHHIKLVHGCEPNRSGNRRLGLAIRYVQTDIQQPKVRDWASLLRGSDHDKDFGHAPRPKRDHFSEKSHGCTPTRHRPPDDGAYSGTNQGTFQLKAKRPVRPVVGADGCSCCYSSADISSSRMLRCNARQRWGT